MSFSTTRSAIANLEGVGVRMPAQVAAIMKAHAAATSDRTAEGTAALRTAIAAGEEQAAIDAAALIRGAAGNRTDLLNLADAAAERAIKAAIAGSDVWHQAAAAFDASASAFTDAIDAVDPDTDPESAARLGGKRGTAWADAPALAHDLDKRFDDLAKLAALLDVPHFNPKRAEDAIPLVAELGAAHPRRVAEAWETRYTAGKASPLTVGTQAPRVSRGGRWTALIATGAKLKALSDPTRWARLDLPALVGGIDPLDGDTAKSEIARIERARAESTRYVIHSS